MKKICHVIFEHRIFDGRIFYKEAVSLATNGFNVVLLAPRINNKTLGKRKEILSEANKDFYYKNIKIESYKYNKILPKIFSLRQHYCIKNILKKIKEIDADIYHFHEDGLTMEVASKLKDYLPEKRLVFDFHEFFLHTYREKEKKLKFVKHYIKLENKILNKADIIFTVTETISNYYKTLCKCPIITLYNCQSKKIFQDEDTINRNDVFWIVHEGRMLFDRGLKLIIEVARKINNPHIKFLFIGNLPESEKNYFQERLKQYDIKNKFKVTGFLPYEKVSEWLINTKIGIVFMSSKNSQMGVPSKFFNYLRFGIPIISLKHPIIDDIIHKHNVGYSFNQDEVDTIVTTIIELYSNKTLYKKLSSNARKLFETELNWDVMEKKLIEAYNSIS